jgi:hypothetical protein
MKLTELLPELSEIGIGPVGSWEIRGKKGIMLGDPKKYFPFRTGPQIPIDCTKTNNPDLGEEEVRTIRRRFGIEEA